MTWWKKLLHKCKHHNLTLVQEALSRNRICLSPSSINSIHCFIFYYLFSSSLTNHIIWPLDWLLDTIKKISLLYRNLCPLLTNHLASQHTNVLDPQSWRTSASSHQAPFLVFPLASMTLSPYPSSLLTWVSLLMYYFWIQLPTDEAKTLSLEGQSWHGSCLPSNTGSWRLRYCHQKQGKKYRLN